MLRHFAQHEAAFSQLASEMLARSIAELRSSVVYYKSGGKDADSAAERDLKALMKQVGASIAYGWVGVHIETDEASRTLSLRTPSKGYAYLETPPLPPDLVDNLDDTRPSENPTTGALIAYRHIEGNWYLYKDLED